MKLIQEADLDDKFNTQLGKIQDAISRLNDIITDMKKPGSMTKPVSTQIMGLRRASQDIKDLWERVQ